jgi:esterase/lipase superfamily enzyme
MNRLLASTLVLGVTALFSLVGCDEPKPDEPKPGAARPNPPTPRNVGPTAAPEPLQGHMVKVFYGTNREPTVDGPDPTRLGTFFGTGRGELRYGTCQISIPEGHQSGVIERPWSLGPIRLPEDPRRHVILRSIDPATRDGFFKMLRAATVPTQPGGEGKEAFVFVHGYNVSFENAAYRTAQMAFDLEFNGPAIMFSWPSQGLVEAYLTDETLASVSAKLVKEFLKGVAKESGAKKIHLIGDAGGPEFDQILLTAPDVDAEVFQEEIAPHFLRSGRRVTLYASTNDWALVASSSLRSGRLRLGENIQKAIGLTGVDSIDASSVDTSLLGHSYFGDKPVVIRDIQAVLRGEPRERRKLIRWGPERQYWAFNGLPPGAVPMERSISPWAIALGVMVPVAILSFLLGRLSKRRARDPQRPREESPRGRG